MEIHNKLKILDNITIISFDSKYEKRIADFVNESMHLFIGRPYKDRPDVLNVTDYYINNGGLFYLALDGEKVIGTIALDVKDDIGILKRFYVDKDYQRYGIGNRLYEIVESFIKDKTNIKSICLTCNEVLKDAHRFYLKRGYKQVDKLDIELQHLDNDYFFKKEI